MFSRWYTAAVILLWVAVMGWLVREKILPPLIVGEPPTYGTIIAAEGHDSDPVAWEILLNGKRLGAASTRTTRSEDNINHFVCEVKLRGVPLTELTPPWVNALVKIVDSHKERDESIIDLTSVTTVDVNSLNHPFAFTSMTKFGPPLLDAQGEPTGAAEFSVSMSGKIEGDAMKIVLRSGDLEFPTKLQMPGDALIGDVLSPQTRLPGLRVGQTWTVPIYSPFRQPNDPLEILHARVDRKDPIFWHDEIVPALLVVYRGDPGHGLSSNQAPRAQMWVDYEGRVVKQEVWLLSSRLTFVRSDSDRNAFLQYLPDDDYRRRKLSSPSPDEFPEQPPSEQ